MRTIYVGGEHEIRCDGEWHWRFYRDSPPTHAEPCNCPKPTFTKRHYEAIVEALEHLSITVNLGEVVNALADMFEADNSQFDRKKFWDACFKEASDGIS